VKEKPRVSKLFAAVILAALFNVPAVRAQAGPVEGQHEIQVWTGGGFGIKGNQSGDGVMNVGLRYGWILTAPHGPGFLRGRLEYAVDAVGRIRFLNNQEKRRSTPFLFSWLFRKRIRPTASE
jgi:hypothetical protein